MGGGRSGDGRRMGGGRTVFQTHSKALIVYYTQGQPEASCPQMRCPNSYLLLGLPPRFMLVPLGLPLVNDLYRLT
jgi:hypothetical protein